MFNLLEWFRLKKFNLKERFHLDKFNLFKWFRLKKENFMSRIAVIYATLIVNGVKTFDEVPSVIKPQVKAVLESLGVPELAEESTPTE